MNGDREVAPALAVALHYDGHDAPRVTATGHGPVAERIQAIAREHGIPLHEDPQLAELLAQIPLGDEIPQALYLAVAEVIAFAYFVSDRTPPDRTCDPAPGV
ncbi:MAG: hypothetical protein B7Z66_05480 [Chromatiales bacterium 21-64-14]|nr:MAG: hypothetical protein B7Z66_05480 [Chromatiales bacterium 21-64-14]HQU15057.1 EscU/YscU/HrcU family type III secretion system export apparatus switch protein [Gammaproteobacteria bacterium]